MFNKPVAPLNCQGCSTFLMNGFYLHRHKAQYGPAQQSFILLNSFNQFESSRIRRHVNKMVCAGCPMASINRIVERGLKHFKHIETVELNGERGFLGS